jgi:hypothetical protein
LVAVDDMRASAKWTLAAIGTVGATLISGGSIAAFAEVHGALHDAIAGSGLGLALAGVGLAFWFTSKVLAPRLTTRATLASPKLARFRAALESSPEQRAAAHALLMQADLRRSRLMTMLGVVLVIAGVVAFVSVTGSSGPTYIPVITTTPAVTASPTATG